VSDAYDRLYSMVRDGKLSSIELTLVFDGGPTRYQATATLPGGVSPSKSRGTNPGYPGHGGPA